MDKDTRNAIERATQRARKLLNDDFVEQLAGDFDVHQDGTAAEGPGEHLKSKPREISRRQRIVAAIEHKQAAGMSAAEAVVDYLRDAAFTTLNRFVALKMLEARELVQECITKGEQSAGYREFCGMAPGGALLPESAGYRLYIESLFDELSTEVKVLFDRRDAASVLWPKRATFEAMLEILNSTELVSVWGQDETIGWIYQFFNSGDERRAMREASQVPRNSRELAVRNQFFTPRYVVQFLTDNTLGRIWYEMRASSTRLVEHCKYLVRRPNEEYVPRAKKDPRDLRILDPACGSGHFLLYAFDLLVVIYEEAWSDETSPTSETTSQSLRSDYATLDALRQVLPVLILRYNLFGVDIDSRCVPIAQLALWMRAQRAFQDFGLRRADRPLIRRSNIVVAEPMPGADNLRRDFLARLDNTSLGEHFNDLVDRMQLAGDLGVLLRVEDLLRNTVKKGQTARLFERPERRLKAALKAFAEEAATTEQAPRKLFADDALAGLGLVETAEYRFDVILMNPPFGETTQRAAETLTNCWPAAKGNLYIAFVSRAFELLASGGRLGAITDATFIHQTRYEDYRDELLDENLFGLLMLTANGWGVLDAYVETACLIASKSSGAQITTFDLRLYEERRAEKLLEVVQALASKGKADDARIVRRESFRKLPKSVLAFWLPVQLLDLYEKETSLDPQLVDARCGMSSSDNPRFYKLWWEVPGDCVGPTGQFRFLANGGAPCPLFRQQVYVVNWGNGGREAKSRVEALYGSSSRTIINEPYYFRGGFTFGKRTESFTAQFLPAGEVFSNEGQAIFPHKPDQAFALLAYLNSSLIAYLLNSIAGQHKEAGYVGSIPCPPVSFLDSPTTTSRMLRAFDLLLLASAGVPESQTFRWPFALCVDEAPSIDGVCRLLRAASVEFEQIFVENDFSLETAVGFPAAEPRPWTKRTWTLSKSIYDADDSELEKHVAADFLGYLFGVAWGRWKPAVSICTNRLADDPMGPLPTHCPALNEETQSIRVGPLVSDFNDKDDVVIALEEAVKCLPSAGEVESQLSAAMRLIAGPNVDFRHAIDHYFFDAHLRRYSRSRRKAPIYWQLSTPSVSYSVWLYYHSLTRDTFFILQNDLVAPKIARDERMLESIRRESGSTPSANDRKRIAEKELLLEELRDFLAEVKRIAPLWNANLNDGVAINYAPLWRLVPHHKAWQKELKSTWEGLCNGEYDWSHFAMHLWPERVVPKCAADRSLAIAHALEDELWVEGSNAKWKPRTVLLKSVEELVRERNSPSVKAALKSLIDAPIASISGRTRGRRPAIPAVVEGGGR